jgi:hypothetical protein
VVSAFGLDHRLIAGIPPGWELHPNSPKFNSARHLQLDA